MVTAYQKETPPLIGITNKDELFHQLWQYPHRAFEVFAAMPESEQDELLFQHMWQNVFHLEEIFDKTEDRPRFAQLWRRVFLELTSGDFPVLPPLANDEKEELTKRQNYLVRQRTMVKMRTLEDLAQQIETAQMNLDAAVAQDRQRPIVTTLQKTLLDLIDKNELQRTALGQFRLEEACGVALLVPYDKLFTLVQAAAQQVVAIIKESPGIDSVTVGKVLRKLVDEQLKQVLRPVRNGKHAESKYIATPEFLCVLRESLLQVLYLDTIDQFPVNFVSFRLYELGMVMPELLDQRAGWLRVLQAQEVSDYLEAFEFIPEVSAAE